MPRQYRRDGSIAHCRRNKPDGADLVEFVEFAIILDETDGDGNCQPPTYQTS